MHNDSLEQQLAQAASIIVQGGVIAYPTEGVYGLGCSPFDQHAVETLLALKKRPLEKGLIVVASEWQQVAELTKSIGSKQLAHVFASWPGAITWIFPASKKAPTWITGAHDSIALRISNFPLIKALCQRVGPLVSTSANIAAEPAAINASQVRGIFVDKLGIIVEADVGSLATSTPIFNASTGEQLR